MTNTDSENAPLPETPENDPLSPEPVPEAAPEASPVNRIAELEAEVVRLKDHILRALADADNTRKRAVKEREDATKFAVTGFARDMLEMADNFRRAIDSVPDEVKNGDDPLITNLLAGIDAIERGLLKTFEKHGIKKIEPLGQMFDPHFHEVMFEAPMPGKPAGTIIQLLEPGYTLNDRLLRPARVGVAKAEPGENGGPTHQVDESV
ncbi:MAG: nucleotide exchange factor GrpE [Micavibrio sp.]